MSSAPTFLVEPAAIAGLSAEQPAELTGAAAHHAVTVRRLQVGERVDLVDGAGRRARTKVVGTETGREPRLLLSVLAVDQEPAPWPRIRLVQALAKGGRDELAVEASAELAVAVVVPWESERAVARWKPAHVRRWEATLTAATQQSRQAHLPQLEPYVAAAQFAQRVQQWAQEGPVWVLHESASAGLPSQIPAALTLLVGPEGGISASELAVATGLGAQCVRLGSSVLRASTAGPAAIAAIRARAGVWDD